MREHHLPPRASSLSESLRDIGYSLETAVADIIDNSITANANEISIWCTADVGQPSLAITDNGEGMNSEELVDAMRHGSRNPRDQRNTGDLGRFGLGLKTASFSQCRKLTVVSRKDDVTSGAVWDLDLLAEKDDWIVGILDADEINAVPWIEKMPYRGTLVVWEEMDRLSEQQTAQSRSEILNEKLKLLSEHLSLVFHRFLSGGLGKEKKILLHVNGHPLEAFDPFCRNQKATQKLPRESVTVSGHRISIQPYILPHHSKLSQKAYDYYRDRSDFLSNQGVYVYRNGRLMVWGDWFRLVPKGEATKLARIQIDFPAELDEIWTIDIKKSRAQPPPAVRERLKQIIGRITNQSERVHSGRSRKLFENSSDPMWSRYVEQGSVRYVPNEDHPLYSGFRIGLKDNDGKKFQQIMEALGTSIPIEAIYSDYSNTPKNLDAKSEPSDRETVFSKLNQIRKIIDPDRSMPPDNFCRIVRSTRLFINSSQLIDEYVDKEFS